MIKRLLTTLVLSALLVFTQTSCKKEDDKPSSGKKNTSKSSNTSNSFTVDGITLSAEESYYMIIGSEEGKLLLLTVDDKNSENVMTLSFISEESTLPNGDYSFVNYGKHKTVYISYTTEEEVTYFNKLNSPGSITYTAGDPATFTSQSIVLVNTEDETDEIILSFDISATAFK